MRIRDKLLLMLSVPTLVLVAFSGRYLYPEWCAYQQTAELTAAVKVIKAVAAVTHGLQAERGASVGYVSSAGKSRESMEGARTKTDGALSTLPEVTSLATSMQPAYQAWRASLGALSEQRQMIDRLSNTPKMVFDAYTARIDGGMGVGIYRRRCAGC